MADKPSVKQTKLQAQIAAANTSIEDYAVKNLDDGLVFRMMSCMARSTPSLFASTNARVELFQGRIAMPCKQDAKGDKDTAWLGSGSSGAMLKSHNVLSDGQVTKEQADEFAKFLDAHEQDAETLAVNCLLSRMWPGKAQFAAGAVLIKVFGSKKALVAYLTEMYGDETGAKAIAGVAWAMSEFMRLSFEYAEPIETPTRKKPASKSSYTTKADRSAEMLANAVARKVDKAANAIIGADAQEFIKEACKTEDTE